MTKIESLKTRLESTKHAALMSAFRDERTDSKVRQYIERELDDRANRGTSKGCRE